MTVVTALGQVPINKIEINFTTTVNSEYKIVGASRACTFAGELKAVGQLICGSW
jgi:hypothetical protein